MFAILNGDLTDVSKASLHISDLAIQRGYGVFDFLKTVNGHPFFLADHLERFFHSASVMKLTVKVSQQEITAMIHTLIARNGLSQSGVKILLTGGYSPDGYTISQPNLLITESPLVLPPDVYRERGVKVITHQYARELPEAKTINYTMGIWLNDVVASAGAYDVLYHQNGLVSEFPRCNVFVVKEDGSIITPSSNVLRGVTRKNLLRLSSRGFNICEADVRLDDVLSAREVFLTSTTKRVIPVVQVDERVIASGRVGQTTNQLHNELLKLEQADQETA